MNRFAPPTQRGLALITAMLVVAIAATVGTYLATSGPLWQRQVGNLTERTQAEAIREGAYGFVSWVLTKDAQQGKTDNLTEEWAKPRTLPIEKGTITVSISDAQARFNINNLVNDKGAPDAASIGMFERLLASQGLDAALRDAVVDWLDADTQARPDGAEDIDYLNMDPGYRAGNQRLQSVDELRLIKGFTAEAVEKLRPYVAALPAGTSINVNTASATIVSAMFPNLFGSVATAVVSARDRKPFDSPAQLLEQLPPGHPQPAVRYDVKTAYFYVNTEIRVGRLLRRSVALVRRANDGKSMNVLWHQPKTIQLKTDAASS